MREDILLDLSRFHLDRIRSNFFFVFQFFIFCLLFFFSKPGISV